MALSLPLKVARIGNTLFHLQEEPIAEGVDDEEELEELRARLAKVRS